MRHLLAASALCLAAGLALLACVDGTTPQCGPGSDCEAVPGVDAAAPDASVADTSVVDSNVADTEAADQSASDAPPG